MAHAEEMFHVLIHKNGTYSILPATRKVPKEYTVVGPSRTADECFAYIGANAPLWKPTRGSSTAMTVLVLLSIPIVGIGVGASLWALTKVPLALSLGVLCVSLIALLVVVWVLNKAAEEL
jgi:uncharacterized protein YbdZ (MbtH family)